LSGEDIKTFPLMKRILVALLSFKYIPFIAKRVYIYTELGKQTNILMDSNSVVISILFISLLLVVLEKHLITNEYIYLFILQCWRSNPGPHAC
jgi:hypothetical protein